MLTSVVIKLAGGIGNQLFQTVFGLSLAQRFSVPAFLNLDSYTNYSYNSTPVIYRLGLDQSLLREGSVAFDPSSTFILYEHVITSIEQLMSLPDGCRTLIVDGYWQNELFLDNSIIDLVYSRLSSKFHKAHLSNYELRKTPSSTRIAVHFRRRDYGHMGLAKNEYYAASLRYLQGLAGTRALSLYSDEPNASIHLLRKLGYTDVEVVKSNDDLQDLYFLSLHKYLIMANSTFSWWGARFGEVRLPKVIVRPAPWLTIGSSLDPCPSRWLSVPNSVESGIISDELLSKELYESLQRSGSAKTEQVR